MSRKRGVAGGDRSLSQFVEPATNARGCSFQVTRARALTHLPLSLRRPPPPPPAPSRSPLHKRNRRNPFLLASAHIRGSDSDKAASNVICGFSNVRMLPLRPYSFQPQSRSLMRHCSCTTLSAALPAASALTIMTKLESPDMLLSPKPLFPCFPPPPQPYAQRRPCHRLLLPHLRNSEAKRKRPFSKHAGFPAVSRRQGPPQARVVVMTSI
jgi:hypothetical protein